MKKYLLILMSFFMVILGITSFSNVENEKVPNELIINNPKKEVTTIESLKNREHGEMNISVTKINPIPITGIERDGKLEFELPEKVELEENIFVTDDVNKIQEHRTLKLNKNLTTFSLENQTEKTKLKVDKPSDSKKIYIAVKEQDKIKRVYENTYMNYNSTDIGSAYIYLDGRVHLGNLYNSNFNKVNSGEFFIGKNGKAKDKSSGRNYDITMPLKSDTNGMTKGSIDSSSIYISSKSETTYNGDYLYTEKGHFGLVLRKSTNLYWVAEGRKPDGILSDELPGCKIPRSYVGVGNVEKHVVAAKYAEGKEYNYTTVIKHAGDDINKFTKDITIDMTNKSINSDYYLDAYFRGPRGERNFLNCIYTQVDSNPEFQADSGRVVATVMTVEEMGIKVGNSDIKRPEKFPKFKVKLNNKYEFNYYNEFGDEYGDRFHFFIKKLGNNVGTKKYTIKVYSGMNYHVLLGVLNLTITNGNEPTPPTPVPPPTPPAPIDIKTASFTIDRRLTNRWIYGDGKTSKNLGNNKEYYSALISSKSFTLNTNLPQIKDARIENTNNYTTQYVNGINYRIFSTSFGKVAIPIGINISNLNENVAIYTNGWISDYKTIKIELVGSDNKNYVGNIEVKGIGESARNTVAKLDLSKWPINQAGIWDNPKSYDTTEAKGQSARLEGETFFNWKSNFDMNIHILTKLKITEKNNGSFETTRTLPNEKLEINFTNNKIGIEKNRGIYIYKTSYSNTPITYKIEGYYKDILLGTTTLTITNQKNSFELVGDNTLDFGNMIYYSNNLYKAEKLFKVKNPNNINLKFSVAPKNTIQNGNDQLQLENITVTKKSNQDFLLEAFTKIQENTKPGKYTGEIQVIVDIDGTGK